jgi:hypothetical protein
MDRETDSEVKSTGPHKDFPKNTSGKRLVLLLLNGRDGESQTPPETIVECFAWLLSHLQLRLFKLW